MSAISILTTATTTDATDTLARLALADALEEAGQEAEAAAQRTIVRFPMPAACDWRQHITELEATEQEFGRWGEVRTVVAFSPELTAPIWEMRRSGNCNLFHCGPEPRNRLSWSQGDVTIDQWREQVREWSLGHCRDNKWLSVAALAAHRDCLVCLGYASDAQEVQAILEGRALQQAEKDLAEDARRRETDVEHADFQALHQVVVCDEIARLLKEAREAYADRRVSEGYWARQSAALLSRPGYVAVVIGADLRGTPPPGVIFVRPATAGRWGRSRAEKSGRPLTATEMRDLLHERHCDD